MFWNGNSLWLFEVFEIFKFNIIIMIWNDLNNIVDIIIKIVMFGWYKIIYLFISFCDYCVCIEVDILTFYCLGFYKVN